MLLLSASRGLRDWRVLQAQPGAGVRQVKPGHRPGLPERAGRAPEQKRGRHR